MIVNTSIAVLLTITTVLNLVADMVGLFYRENHPPVGFLYICVCALFWRELKRVRNENHINRPS